MRESARTHVCMYYSRGATLFRHLELKDTSYMLRQPKQRARHLLFTSLPYVCACSRGGSRNWSDISKSPSPPKNYLGHTTQAEKPLFTQKDFGWSFSSARDQFWDALLYSTVGKIRRGKRYKKIKK